MFFQKLIIQLCQMNVIPLSSKPYINEVTLSEQKWPLKCYQPPDLVAVCKQNSTAVHNDEKFLVWFLHFFHHKGPNHPIESDFPGPMVSLPDGQGVVITGSSNYYPKPDSPIISQFHPQNKSWTTWEQNLKWPRSSHSNFVIPESLTSCKNPGMTFLQKLVGQLPYLPH